MDIYEFLGRNRITKTALAQELGLSRKTVTTYLSNPERIPKYIKMSLDYFTQGMVSYKNDWDKYDN